MSRTTYSTTYYCRNSKTNKAGLAPLELCICINQKRVFINLPVKFSPKDFNKKRKPTEIEQIITQYRIRVNEIIADMMQQHLPITAISLKSWLQTGGTKTYTLEMLCTEFLAQLKCTPKIYRKYELAMNFIMDNLGATTEITSINVGMINQLYASMKEKFLPSTSAGYMTKAKTLFQYAMDYGKIKINPCNGIKISKGTPTVSYLSNDDINKIKGLKLDDYDRLNRVRQLLLFQLSTGLSYIDMVNFNSEKITIIDGVPTYTSNRQKTGVEFTTVILPMGMDVLKKYDGVLPLISNQKYNAYLKEIQRLAGVKTTITTHLLRRTYATRLLNANVNLSVIAKALGHSNTTITQKHYAKTTDNFVVEEIGNAIKGGLI